MNIWKFGGYDLTSFGVLTLLDDYLDVAERRGNNQIVPYRHGTIFVPKYYDERVLTFGLAIHDETSEAVESKLDVLRTLLSPRTQQTLSRTLQNGTIRTG